MSGGDLGLLVEKLDEPFPVMTQDEARSARLTIADAMDALGLPDAERDDEIRELISMLGLTGAQMAESRWAESPT